MVASLALLPARGRAQAAAPAAAPGPAKPPGPAIIVRQVVMQDAHAAEKMKERLDAMKAGGAFKETFAGPVPNTALSKEVQFMVAGNTLLVIGEPEKVERNIDAIRLMSYMAERPRAHLEMNLRVVQITGPANTEVTQLSEAVQALVQSQRDEVVRTFGDLGEYLNRRLHDPTAGTGQLVKITQDLLPTLGTGERTSTVPETLLLLMLDRLAMRMKPAAPVAPEVEATAAANAALRKDLLALPRHIARLISDPNRQTPEAVEELRPYLQRWMARVDQLRQRFHSYGVQLEKTKGTAAVTQLKDSLALPDGGVPDWIALRLSRSLEVTERTFPSMAREHAIKTVAEFERRFEMALKRGQQLQGELDEAEKAHKSAGDNEHRDRAESKMMQTLVSLKTLAESLAPPPMALLDQVGHVVEAVSPTPEQVITLFRDYSAERRKLDLLIAGADNAPPVNYAKLQSLEAALNLWLRRAAEALGRALAEQFYSQYTNELRLLANRDLGRSSNRDLLNSSSLSTVPDVARDELLAGSQVNIFLSNSISLQFAPDTTNSVSAQVQSSLPSQQTLPERLQAANGAIGPLKALNAVPGLNLDAPEILGSLLSGGQPVPVRDGMSFSATPSIGYDAGTVSLVLTTNQTLEPSGEKVSDRVANHSISNATITAISYEPMVLSTLASNTSYYEQVGGIPVLRKVPLVKELLNDVPVTPFKTYKRQRGVVQASVLILEPVVIPTIEDLVRYQSGYRVEAGVGVR